MSDRLTPFNLCLSWLKTLLQWFVQITVLRHRKLKETIDGTAVDNGQLLEQMSTPALSLPDDEEALEGAETLQAFRLQASDRLHVRPAENSVETGMTETGHAETPVTSPSPPPARRSFLEKLLSPQTLFSPKKLFSGSK